MTTKRIGWALSFGCALAGAWCSAAFTGETEGPPTAAVRLDFLKGYNSWSPRERREAATILTTPQYRDDPQVGAVLHDMARFDKDPEIRLSAFVALCGWKDLDGRFAYHMAHLFKLELEPSIKPRMAQAMTQLKFKTDVLNTLITYTFSHGVDYPDYGGYGWNNNSNRWGWGGWGRNGKGADWLESANYRTLLEAINKISGKRFVPAVDTARQVMEWWHLNAVDFQEDDRKLAQHQRETGEGTPALAAVTIRPDKPTDARLADMFDRLEKEAKEAALKAQQKKPTVAPKEEDIE
jgi:hypothetical protein